MDIANIKVNKRVNSILCVVLRRRQIEAMGMGGVETHSMKDVRYMDDD